MSSRNHTYDFGNSILNDVVCQPTNTLVACGELINLYVILSNDFRKVFLWFFEITPEVITLQVERDFIFNVGTMFGFFVKRQKSLSTDLGVLVIFFFLCEAMVVVVESRVRVQTDIEVDIILDS